MVCSRSITGCIPTRYSFAILLMGVVLHLYTLRANFSIIVIAMVENSPNNVGNNSMESECSLNTSSQDKYVAHLNIATGLLGSKLYNETTGNATEGVAQDKFSWDTITQGRILGAHAYGYVVSQVAGGFLETRFGGKKVLGLSMLLVSGLTLLTPVAAFSGEWSLFVVRFLTGLLHGVIMPSVFGLLSRWAPPTERGRIFTIIMLGETFGVVVGFSLTAFLIAQFGWAATLYITGVESLAFCCLWCCLAFDSPADHPRISEKERRYIESNLETTKRVTKIPWFQLLTSAHLWVLIYIHCVDSFGYNVLLMCLPLYMDAILNFNIEANGGLSTVPYLFQTISRIVASLVIDPIIKRSTYKRVNIRKACISFLVAVGACLVAVGHVGCDAAAVTVLLCLVQAFRGVLIPGFYPSYTELTLGFSGVAFGMSTSVAGCAGFLVPLMAGFLTDRNQTIEAWQKVFYISGAVCVSGSAMALAFLRTDPLSWAQDSEEDKMSQPAQDSLIRDKGEGEAVDAGPVLVYESMV